MITVKNSNFQFLSGLEALKIDIVNSFGHDKLTFKDRLTIFDTKIKPRIKKNTTADYLVKLVQELKFDEPELGFVGLLAYIDYLNNRASGYMVSFDATASGIQLMSALMGDEEGMRMTNLIDNQRHDVYTEIYEVVKEYWKVKQNSELNLSRSDIKKAIMVMMYGGYKSVMNILGNDRKLYFAILAICNHYIKGASVLKDILLNCISTKVTSYTVVAPDGFTMVNPILVNYQETRVSPKIGKFTVKYKDLGTVENYKGNAANLIHCLDGLIMREVISRCNYKHYILTKMRDILIEYYTSDAKKPTGINPYYSNETDIFKKSFLSIEDLEEMVYNYNFKSFLFHADRSVVDKVARIVNIMLSYSPFEVLGVHDCFKTLPSNVNYVRFWYKEVIAELMEGNVLNDMIKQLPEHTAYMKYIKPIKPKLIDMVRKSNYAIC